MIVNTLREYASELKEILSRFTVTSNSLHIESSDAARFRQISFELADIFKDELTDGTRYYQQLMSDYNESISNWLNSPSYAGVERVLVLVNAVINRIERNPSIVGKPSNNFLDKIEKNDSFIRLIADKFIWLLDSLEHDMITVQLLILMMNMMYKTCFTHCYY